MRKDAQMGVIKTAVVIVAIIAGISGVVWVAKTWADHYLASISNDNPVVTQTIEPSQSPPVSQPESKTAPLSLFYVAVDDNGVSGTEVGCGDSLVMTTTEPVTFTNQVKASFDRLLADHEQRLGESGLYNALYQSRLSYVGSSVSGDTVTVNLTGELQSGGTCDDPRIITQLKRAASVAAGVGNAVVKIDGVTVEQRLSAR